MAEKKERKSKDGKPKDNVKPPVVENEKETLDLELKRLEVFEKKLDLQGASAKDGLEVDRVAIDKINSLRWLLSDTMIDETHTQLGSEPKLKHLLESADQDIIRKKIMDLVKTL